MKSILLGTVAVAVALVVILSGLGVLLPAAASPSSPGSGIALTSSEIKTLQASPAPAPPAPLGATNSQNAFAGKIASYVGLSPGQEAAIQQWLGSLSHSQVVALKADGAAHVAPTASVLASFGLAPAAISYYCFGTSVVAGAAIGGVVGGGPFGVLIGGIAGAIAGYYFCQQSGVADNIGKQFVSWAEGVMAGYGNEANLTAAEFQSLISALNLTTIGWERAADHAALFQLGNSSFNISEALYQGGIYQNLAAVPTAYASELSSEYLAVVKAVDGHGGPNDVYASAQPAASLINPAGVVGGYCGTGTTFCDIPPGPSAAFSVGAALATGSGENYIPGAVVMPANFTTPVNLTVLCTLAACPTGPGVIHLYNQLQHIWYNATILSSGCVASELSLYGICTADFTGPTGMYYLPFVNGETVYAAGGQPTPVSPTSGWTNLDTIIHASAVNYAGPNPLLGSPTQSVAITCLTVAVTCATGAYEPATYLYNPTPGPTWADLQTWLTAIEWQAAINAEAYWSFLRAAGFTSLQSIPADCLIPAPYLVLPSSINEANLNLSEWESMYLAALEGMGHFYNVTLSGTSFCGTQAPRQWSWGGSVWGNLFVNATGFVYLTNGSTPVDYAGHALPTEKFSNHATWAIGNTLLGGTTWFNGSQQLILMPTIKTASIPVGVPYEVPAGNPIQIYAVQTGLDLWLNGNGTVNGSIPSAIATHGGLSTAITLLGTATAGDAIYLTSCTVGGQASGNCTVTVQTVNVTIIGITCTGPCSQGAPGGTFGGLPNPFSWLAGLFSGLFGGGPLGQLLGGIVSALLILAVIVILGYVAIGEVGSWRSKKRGGGGGGTTAVTRGGR